MHRHAFFRAARTPQPALLQGADVERLADLDPTLWVVLARPRRLPGGEDGGVADAIGGDDAGRVRVPDVLAAIDWLRPRLASFDRLFLPFAGLVPEDVRADTPEGKPLADLLAALAKEGPVTAEAIDRERRAFEAEPLNGSDALPVEAIPDAPLRDLARLLLRLAAPEGGTRPLPREDALRGLETLDAWRAWRAERPDCPYPDDDLEWLGRLAGRIDRFFADCEALRFSPEAAVARLDPGKPLAEGPLALPSAEADALPLRRGVNPAWRDDAARLADLVGADCLTRGAWEGLKAASAPARLWLGRRPGGDRADDLAALDRADTPETRARLLALYDANRAKAPTARAFEELGRLAALRGGLLRFLRNFVNVADLYPPRTRPVFLEGRLYLDGRRCALCFPLGEGEDTAAHAAAAKASRCCLAYCEATRQGRGPRAFLAVFTAGSTGHLAVGKRGLYVDGRGDAWDAAITLLDLNAISLTEAFFAPWRKIAQTCAETARRLVSGKGDAAAATASALLAKAAPQPPPAASGTSRMASAATLGIALSFVATAVATLASAATRAPLWKTGAVVAGLVLAVSVPSVILAWCRLRNRDLAPILNASGWAVNLPIGLTARLGAHFTHAATTLGRRFVLPRKE